MKTHGILISIVTILVIIAVALPIIGCAPSAPVTPTPQKPQTTTPSTPATTQAPRILKFSYDMPKTGAIVRGWEWFAAELEKRTNGSYKIDFYPAQSLIKQSQILEAIVGGATDISSLGPNAQSQAMPVCTVVSLPSTHFPDTKEGHAAASDAVKELLAKFPAMSNELKNFKLNSWNTLPANIIMSKNTKIVVPDDMKGVKSASQGNDRELIRLAGGVPVSMPPAEVYQALDKSVVEAATVSWIHLTSNHYEEIAQYYLDIALGNDVQLSIMALSSWNSLSPDVQKIITDLLPEMQARSDEAYIIQMAQGRKLAVDKNRTITPLTPEQKKLWEAVAQPLDQAWIDNVKSKGITDGPAILSLLQQRSAEAWAKNK
jgi:TRAP-type C4-dicarboxylate transport system substrate-binding protein